MRAAVVDSRAVLLSDMGTLGTGTNRTISYPSPGVLRHERIDSNAATGISFDLTPTPPAGAPGLLLMEFRARASDLRPFGPGVDSTEFVYPDAFDETEWTRLRLPFTFAAAGKVGFLAGLPTGGGWFEVRLPSIHILVGS